MILDNEQARTHVLMIRGAFLEQDGRLENLIALHASHVDLVAQNAELVARGEASSKLLGEAIAAQAGRILLLENAVRAARQWIQNDLDDDDGWLPEARMLLGQIDEALGGDANLGTA